MNLTIGIISCNRLKYLKSLIESLKCLKPENTKHNIEIIAVDNGSKEDGLKEYLELEKTNGFIDKLFLREERDWCNDEYHAKNVVSNLDARRTYQDLFDPQDLSEKLLKQN